MKACSCEYCVSACLRDSGRLVPADVTKIATFLSISEKQLLAEYLVIIPSLQNHLTIYTLAPAKSRGHSLVAPTGRVVPDYYDSENGRCIFLEADMTCRIHEVKPFECHAYMGCQHTFLGRPYRLREVETFFATRWRSYQKKYFHR